MALSVNEFKELHDFIDKIFEEAARMRINWVKLADKANLSWSTVYRLGNYDTCFPRASTVFALAKAVGFKVQLVKGKTVLKLRVA